MKKQTYLVGTGESLGDDRGDITGDENGAELLLAGRKMNDFSCSGFTLPCRINNNMHVHQILTENRLHSGKRFAQNYMYIMGRSVWDVQLKVRR